MMRIAVLNSHPIQYFAPLYAHLNQGNDLQVTALYCSDVSLRGAHDPGFKRQVTWDIDLLSGYQAVFLGRRARRRVPRGFFSLIVPEVWGEVRSGRYDALLLHGYNYVVCLIAFCAAKSRGLPVMMRSETHLGQARSRGRRALRDGVLRFAYRFVDRFLAIGSANRDYYLSLGVPSQKIFTVPYAVDNDRFMKAAILSPQERRAVRVQFGLPADRPVVLFASKLMPGKHPEAVIDAAADLRARGKKCSVLIVGSGEMEGALRARTTTLGLTNVFFAGFLNQAELPRVYGASDIFVLPCENEAWGLVVNEVMCAGLPVVVSGEAGCVADLVHDGVNGFVIRPGERAALAATLERLLASTSLRRKMGEESLGIIRRWSYEECRLGFLAAVRGLTRESAL